MEYLECTEPLNKWLLKKLPIAAAAGRIFAWMQGFFFAVCVLSSCSDGKVKDTATSGDITISVDEAFQPLIAAEVDAFEAAYKYAQIRTIYTSENEAVQWLLKDSVRSVIMTRTLTPEERGFFEAKKIIPDTLRIAREAVALVVNKSNPDSLLTVNHLRAILTGDISTWNEISNKGRKDSIVIVFDKANSSNVSYFRQKFNLNTKVENKLYAAGSNQEVLEYVQKNKNALGVIGVSWISDSEDPKQQKFRNEVAVVAMAEKDDAPASEYYQPYAAYLQTRQYPLYRDLYIVSREARTGLGTGFAAYVASEKGQLIVLKAGLLPATMPVRLVQVK